jgi:hypothetical protein
MRNLMRETGETCGVKVFAPPPFFLAHAPKHLADLQRIFSSGRAVGNFEIHKLFLQFQTFVQMKISR